ncbi:MAG: PAS domain S-box protein [Leptolyngbyaceae cyanobacterium bins.302]|nr:PAS domain S-box protein [Leptolyngbyaceae cyanobacterium bins.302]
MTDNIPLHWVLVIPFVLLTTGAVSLVGYLSYWSGRQAVEELGTELITEVGDRIDQNLTHYFREPAQIARTNALATQLGGLNWQNFPALKQYLWQQLDIYDVTAVGIITEKKQFLVIRKQDDGSRVIRLSDASTNFAIENRLADSQGNPTKLLSRFTNFNPHNYPPSDPCYEQTRQSGDSTWLVHSIVVNKQAPTLAAINFFPFYDRANQFQGVVLASISLTKVGEFLKRLDIGDSGKAFVIERNGKIIGTSTSEQPFRDLSKEQLNSKALTTGEISQRLNALDSQDPITQSTAQQLVDRFGRFDRITGSHQLTIEIDHQRYFVQVKPFGSEQNLDWLRVVVLPESDFMEKIEANTSRTILLCWLTLFATMAIGILTARWITKPIHKLSHASQALAQGDWQQVLSDNTLIAELKTLIHSFNQTAKILASSFDRIKTALQESEEKFTKVFQNSPDPIAITTIEGQYLEVNDSFTTFSEYTREEIKGKTSLDLKFSANLQQDIELRKLLKTQGTVTSFEYQYQTKSGRFGTTLLSLEQIELDGQLCVLTVAKDITERKQMEYALRSSEARFQKITRAVPGEIYILIMHLDGSFSFEYMSPGCREIQEMEPEQIVADPLSSFEQVHPDDRAMMYAGAVSSAETLEPFYGEWRIITPSGKVKWVQVSSRPERREHGDTAWYGILQDVSNFKRIEAQLRKTEHWLQQFSRQSPSIIYTIVQESNGDIWFEYISSAIETIYEISVEAILQNADRWLESIHSDDRAAYQAAMLDSRQTLNPFCHQWRITTPSGFIKWVQGTSQPEQRQNGAIAWHGVVQDMTDRKRGEDALAHSESRLRAILSAIPDVIKIYAIDGTYVDSMQTNNLHDLVDDPNPIGKHVKELVPADVAERLLAAIARLIETQEPQIYEQEVWVHDRLQYEELRVVPCGDQAILGIIRDISDRRLHELESQLAAEALRESEERFRRAFDDAAIGMAWIGLNGRFLKVSRSLCEILGYTEQELLTYQFQDLTHPDDLALDEEFSQQMLKNRQRAYQREKRYIHREGHIIWVLVHMSLVRDREENPLYFVCQIQDISDRHELDRIKDEFISIVSHELRTPLTAIRGSLGILETGVLDGEPETFKKMLQVALNNSDRLVRLVNDILDLERLESGKVDLMMEECQVDDLLQQALESVQSIAVQAAITIQVTSLDIRVWVAPDMVVQAIVNLLGNAIKFSPPASTIWLKAERITPDVEPEKWQPEGDKRLIAHNQFSESHSSSLAIAPTPNSHLPTPYPQSHLSYVLFSVQDQGRGIPPEKTKTIFGRFQQVDVSDARKKGGTGLGLAICKSIVQQHGGNIWVDSVVNQGSTFYFTVPCSDEE